jgi:hypothetical protein
MLTSLQIYFTRTRTILLSWWNFFILPLSRHTASMYWHFWFWYKVQAEKLVLYLKTTDFLDCRLQEHGTKEKNHVIETCSSRTLSLEIWKGGIVFEYPNPEPNSGFLVRCSSFILYKSIPSGVIHYMTDAIFWWESRSPGRTCERYVCTRTLNFQSFYISRFTDSYIYMLLLSLTNTSPIIRDNNGSWAVIGLCALMTE